MTNIITSALMNYGTWHGLFDHHAPEEMRCSPQRASQVTLSKCINEWMLSGKGLCRWRAQSLSALHEPMGVRFFGVSLWVPRRLVDGESTTKPLIPSSSFSGRVWQGLAWDLHLGRQLIEQAAEEFARGCCNVGHA